MEIFREAIIINRINLKINNEYYTKYRTRNANHSHKLIVYDKIVHYGHPE